MAFYNPQRVVFDPDTMTIKNAGAVGDFLYNASRDYLKRQDELAQQKAQQEQWDRQHQLENDKFAYQQNQDAFNNNLKLNEFNFNQTKWGQEHTLKQRAQDTDEWYKRQNVAQGWGNLNVARQNANTSAMNANTSAARLKLEQAKQEAEQAGINLLAPMENLSSLNSVVDNIKKIKDAGINSPMDVYGVGDATWQLARGIVGKTNYNDLLDTVASIMSKSIFDDMYERQTNYTLEQHESDFPRPSALVPQTVNQQRMQKMLPSFMNSERAKLEKILTSSDKKFSPAQKQDAINDYFYKKQFVEDFISGKMPNQVRLKSKFDEPQNATQAPSAQAGLQNQVSAPQLQEVDYNGVKIKASAPDKDGFVIVVAPNGAQQKFHISQLQ